MQDPPLSPMPPAPPNPPEATVRAEVRSFLPPVVAAQEAERLRVARELHDDLGQHLLALKLELSRITLGGDTDSASTLRQRVHGLLTLVDGSMAAVRRIAADLRPPELGGSGLVPALQSLTRQARARLSVNVELDDRCSGRYVDNADFAVKLAAYRIVQEALSNAVRHAGASRVRVEVGVEASSLVLRVLDDGQGLGGQLGLPRQGLGLRGMRERAEACGGRLEIGDAPGGGCIVVARLPLVGAAGPSGRGVAGEVN